MVHRIKTELKSLTFYFCHDWQYRPSGNEEEEAAIIEQTTKGAGRKAVVAKKDKTLISNPKADEQGKSPNRGRGRQSESTDQSKVRLQKQACR